MENRTSCRVLLVVMAVFAGSLLLCAEASRAEPIVISGCGNITSRIAEFRSLVGNLTAINWDADTASIKARVFTTSGIEFATEGTGFRVSGNNFSDLDPSYSSQFPAFSSPNSIAPIGSKRVHLSFNGGTVKALGIVFTDVDRLGSTTVELEEAWEAPDALVVAPPRCDVAGHSFVGVILPNDSVANSVWIVSGDGPPNAGNADVSQGGMSDLVTIDDIFYSTSPSHATKVTFPIIARTEGDVGTFFKTDVKIVNPSDTAFDVLLRLHHGSTWDYGIETKEATITVAPREEKVLDDILMNPFLMSDGIASFQIFSPRPVFAVARIYNDQREQNEGTFGQFAAGIKEDTGTRDVISWPAFGVLPALSNSPIGSGPYRTNIGLFNDGANPATIILRAYDPNGNLIATSNSVVLSALDRVQKSAVEYFPSMGPRENFYVTYNTDVGTVRAYASVVDNVNGDAMYIPSQLMVNQQTTELAFPIVARASGLNGTHYKTDMWIVNPFGEPAIVTLNFYPGSGFGTAVPSASRVITVAVGEERVLDDLLRNEFGMEKGGGALLVSATRPVIAVARAYNDQSEADKGTFGQFMDGSHHDATTLSRSGLLPALSDSATYRTNIGWFNAGASDASLVLRAFDSGGILLATTTIPVPAHSQLQQNVKTIFGNLGIRNNFYVTYLSDVEAPIYVYASVVDNVNGDGIYVPAEPLP